MVQSLANLTEEFTAVQFPQGVSLLSSRFSNKLLFWAQQGLTCESCFNLFVDNNINHNTPLSCGHKHIIQTVLFVLRWWPPEVYLGAEPPVKNVDALLRLCGEKQVWLECPGSFQNRNFFFFFAQPRAMW
jgi:hypothetical protein